MYTNDIHSFETMKQNSMNLNQNRGNQKSKIRHYDFELKDLQP